MSTDILFLPALEQARLMRSGALSPVELTRATLAQIERLDGQLRAWISVDAEGALAQARAAEVEIRAGRIRGPLHGLPFGVKDQMHALGLPTTLGTRVLDPEETVAPYDAHVIARLRAAGAVLIGKQNLHEFGKGGTLDFPYGQPRNPWNPEYDPSSSSSGSGIAPAAGMCSFAIGEDTGGSVRGPASCNGIAGLRPTFGRVSRHGGIMHAYTTDTFGPLGRTVGDCAAVLAAIAGHDPGDPLSSKRAVPDFLAGLDRPIRGLRLGVVTEIAHGEGTDPVVRAAFDRALDVLRDQGAVIEEVSLPLSRWAVPLQLLSADADVAAWFLNTYLRDRYDRFDKGTRTRLAASSMIPASIYNRAMRARVIVRQQVLNAFERFDALLTPTNVTPPRRIDQSKETVSEDREDMIERLIRRRISHYPFSLANVPALSVPMGLSPEGLPLALQIAGRPFDEETVFALGQAHERATDWARQHPPLAQGRPGLSEGERRTA